MLNALRSSERSFGPIQFSCQPRSQGVALFDLANEAIGLRRDHGAFFCNLVEPASHVGQSPRRFAGSRPPVRDVGPLSRHALAGDCQRLIVRGKFGDPALHRCPRGLVFCTRRFQRQPAGLWIGQGSAPCFRGGELGEGSAMSLVLFAFGLFEFGEACFVSFARGLRTVESA